MLARIVETCVRARGLVMVAMLVLLAYGVYQYRRMPVDAFPDISPVMVPIFAEAHGMAPEEVERLITFPIESSMNGLPDVTLIKSTSAFGLAVVYVYFRDDVDIYFARQIVSERLASAVAEMPEMHEPPVLGPISTGLGEVFMYYLSADATVDTEGKDKNTWLREINDWVVKFQLQTVPGVTEILSMGGHVLQYQVEVNPYALHEHDLGLDEIVEAIGDNNDNAGGQFLVLGSEEYLVRGIGLIEDLEDLRNIQIRVHDGAPVRIRDVAEVAFGNEIRRGVVSHNGEEEVVAGIVMKLFGENTSLVIERLEEKFARVAESLPTGVTLVPYYNQSRLVQNATGTVKEALLEGAALVLCTLLLFSGNVRVAFIVVLALPLCAMTAVIFMGLAGLSANLMSLGGIAIAIGMLGDASVVMVENIHRNLSDEKNTGRSKTELIILSANEVGQPILFAVAIIIIVFLPLFTLEGVEGKMFAPVAFTISFALLGAIVSAIVFAPVLASFLLKAEQTKEFFVATLLKRLYRPLLTRALRLKVFVTSGAVVAFIISMLLAPHLGTEFIPVLEEGVIQINVTMAPSISLVKGTEAIMQLERVIRGYKEVESTIAKIGRPEAGSHPHPVNFANIQIALKPQDAWKDYGTKGDLIEALDHDLSQYPGMQLSFTQPIQNLFDELLSGVRTQLAIKLYGDDLSVLRTKAEEIRGSIEGIPGLVDLATEQSFGQPQVQIIADRDACARYGVAVSEMLEIVETAIGGEVVDQIFVNTRRFGINVRYQEQYRNSPEAIENLLVRSSEGYKVPLSQVAQVRKLVGPIQINREKNQRRWTIAANVRGRDLGSVVADIKNRVSDQIRLPPGYYLEYGGQFENQQRAMKRLSIIVPTTLVLIFFMLYLGFQSLRYALLIFVNVPLALIGGIFGLFITREYMSVPASVGFIALFGIAVQDGFVLVSFINRLRREGIETSQAVVEGAMLRIRPVCMVVLTTILGLVPLLLSRGMGSEVQRPLAVVVVFGLASSTFLTLFLIPALYEWFAPKAARREPVPRP